jgi:outer membrane protein OmpA-like peptidoglycan-associated protein
VTHLDTRPSARLHPPRLAAVALLLAAAAPAAASEASLELFYGHDSSGWLALRSLEVKLDGVPLPVQTPQKGGDPAQVLLRGPLTTGAHRLDVAAGLEGNSTVFTYVEDVRFTMRGVLQLDVQPGDVVEVRSHVVAADGVTVKWEDRFRLALDATVRKGAHPVVAAAPATPAPAPEAAPAPAPEAAAATLAPQPAARPPPAHAERCALPPVRFAFDKATLTADAEAALDAFAACLAGSGGAVRLEGHCDGQGPDLYNEWLGAQRAAAAARRLRERGVAPERITVRSMSAGSPTCTDVSVACNARNRRVEAVVLE